MVRKNKLSRPSEYQEIPKILSKCLKATIIVDGRNNSLLHISAAETVKRF